MGDERFQGEEISEDGLKMIMDLATKESKKADKSLMSKLIQSSDAFAILRTRAVDVSKFKFDQHDVFNDLSRIDYKHAPNRDRLQKLLREFLYRIEPLEKNAEFLVDLEFAKDPQESFMNSEKAKLTQEQFQESLRILQTDPDIERLPSHNFGDELIYVHALTNSSPFPLEKQGQFFRCATALCPGIVIRGYADRSWRNNPVLILNSEKDGGIVYVAGFKTDVGSSSLYKQDTDDLTNIELSHIVRMTPKPPSYYDRMILTEDELRDKLKEMQLRRLNPELDMSSTRYHVYFGCRAYSTLTHFGYQRYQDSYSPHLEISTDSGELRHNEIHILNSVHISDFVGISKDVFEHLPRHKTGQFSDSSFFGLLRLNFYKDQINFEKTRLLGLTNPMEDKKFKDCVEFELSRVTNLFEKIVHLNKLKNSLADKQKSREFLYAMKKKSQSPTAEIEGYEFLNTDENIKIYIPQKIAKIEKTLESLYSDLEKFEQDDNLGLKGLKDKAREFSTAKNIKEKSSEFKKEIMEGRYGVKPLEFAIRKVKEGLEKETKMALYDIFNSQEIKILSDEEFQRKITKSPELFYELCERKDYSSILLIFKKDEIEEMVKNTEKKLTDGSKLPDFKTIFRKALIDTDNKLNPNKLGLLIKMALNIYESQEVPRAGFLCQCFTDEKYIIDSTFSGNTAEDLEVKKFLEQFGFKNGLKRNDRAINFGVYRTKQFKEAFLQALNLYQNESDLSTKSSALSIPFNVDNRIYLNFEFKKINGYGLLNILDQYPQIEQDFERDTDQTFIDLNNKLKIAIKNLRDLRGDTQPRPIISRALTTAPRTENNMR